MLSTALTGGFVAGQEAAKSVLARGKEKIPDPEAAVIAAEKERVYRPFTLKDGYSPREFEDLIRQVMNFYMGYNRNAKGLQVALDKLGLIERYSGDIKAANPHELTRANEALHLLPYAQMMVVAVMKRGAFTGFYKRSDVEFDKEIRKKHVSLWREGGAIKSCYDPIGD
jgi:succinate dehydrogenase/fumarate reductase flavoprotein subunit